jgi:ABC-2 type transport system ATP-binding protein
MTIKKTTEPKAKKSTAKKTALAKTAVKAKAEQAGKTVLSVKDVTISYGKTEVVHNAAFDVAAGEMFGLIGLNGAGKTTLMKTILGLREPAKQGKIAVFGHLNTNMDARKDIVYLPENFSPPWFLTGMEFVEFSLKLYKQPFSREIVIEAAEKLALDVKALDRRVQTYSKGMRQKLGLIGTVLTNCRLMILDEPMSGLDPLARTLVKDMLLDVKSREQTIFICSHILADLDEICNRVAVIHKGHIEFVGPPSELKKQTAVDNLERAFLQFIEKSKAA